MLDEDIIALVAGEAAKIEGRIILNHFEISRKEGRKPKAEVTVTLDGKTEVKEALGDGPVDAAYNAINLATRPMDASHDQAYRQIVMSDHSD